MSDENKLIADAIKAREVKAIALKDVFKIGYGAGIFAARSCIALTSKETFFKWSDSNSVFKCEFCDELPRLNLHDASDIPKPPGVEFLNGVEFHPYKWAGEFNICDWLWLVIPENPRENPWIYKTLHEAGGCHYDEQLSILSLERPVSYFEHYDYIHNIEVGLADLNNEFKFAQVKKYEREGLEKIKALPEPPFKIKRVKLDKWRACANMEDALT